MNRMWSVLTAPCLVETVVPSIKGSRSRCTPSRETSPPTRPSRTQILSISSRNTMPLFSTAPIDSSTSWSVSSNLSDSSLTRSSWESATVRRRVLVRPPILPKISPIEIAADLLDVAADIADLGEFCRLDLDKRRAGKFSQPPRDLGLADAGRPDHQDIFRQHLFAQGTGELQPPPAVAQRDGDRALGVGLADDEAVEFGNDFAGGEVGHWL